MATLKFWGVRGSIPTPGPQTVRYGGNTSCAELRHDGKLFILDAGSGIRLLGNELLKSGTPTKAGIFISHMHWDHIQGIPFFTPAFLPQNHFTFYGAQDSEKNLLKIISDQMDPTYFPIELKDMAARLEFKTLFEGSYSIDGIQIQTMYVNHPGNALGYKFFLDGNSLVYISDNEPFTQGTAEDQQQPQDTDDIMLGEDGNQKLISFLSGTHTLVHDAQYTSDEYAKKMTWGHSPINYTVEIALQSGIQRLILFHHDPMHDDDTVDQMLQTARALVAESGKPLEVLAAMEGMEVQI